MNDFNPKQGEMIRVRATTNLSWQNQVFAAKHGGLYHCEQEGTDCLFPWRHAESLPTKPEPIPFTHETWPKQVVWLRFAGNGGLSHGVQVIDFFAEGVCMKNTYPTFQDLTNSDWQMSLDFCQTWQPCHYNPNPTE